MHPKLAELASRYARTKQHLTDLESATGLLSLTTRTINDIRHTLDHVLRGVAREADGDSQQAEYLYEQGAEHLREHALNSYENVAGRSIKETRERLQGAPFYRSQDRAVELYDRAVSHYSLGRQRRTEDEDAALSQFKSAALLAIEARQYIEHAPPYQRLRLWLAIVGALTGLTALAIALFTWLGSS